MFSAGDKFDKYTIKRMLGEGGMALVYEATNPFGVSVVLKMLHPSLLAADDVRERFHREGRIQYTLKHPHIVRVTDIVEQDGLPALVVDFMAGEDLEHRLEGGQPLPTADIIQISTKLLDGLQLAHKNGFVHRDLKPSNIFLETTDMGFEPRLMDFGIAKIEEAAALTRAQEFCGTPAFASPEQIASTKDVDHLTDIYSFGVVMWSMCAGVEPYAEKANDAYAVLAAVVRENLPALPERVPAWLRKVIGIATQKDKRARFATAAEFRDAILAGANSSEDYADTVVDMAEAVAIRDSLSGSVLRPPEPATETLPALQPEAVRPISGARPVAGKDPVRRPVPGKDPVRRAAPRREAPQDERTTERRAADPYADTADRTDRPTPESLPAAESSRPVPSPNEATTRRRPTRSEAARARAVERSFRGERGTPWLKIIAGAVALAVAGVGAFVAYGQLGGLASSAPDGFVRIEPLRFTMGSPADEHGHDADEEQHDVRITRPFAISITEVTQGEWGTLMFSTPGAFGECGDSCPITNVSWHDAVRYANRLSTTQNLTPCYEFDGNAVSWPEGLDCEGYRLPTEAEWEAAARAGEATAFYNGDLTIPGRAELDPRLSLVAWYAANSDAAYRGAVDCSGWGEGRDTCGPQSVQGRRGNTNGLFDMHGNVAEWVWDRYAPYDGDAVDPTGAVTGSQRVIRGGSWRDTAESCRAGARDRSASVGRNHVGFRLARTLR